MDATEQPPEPTAPDMPDPVELTRKHLAEIGEVWVSFARQRAEEYKAKLPDSVKQLLDGRTATPDPTEEVAETGPA